MAVYVGLWDCSVCGRKANPGPETKCSGCGAARPPDVRFYLPSDTEALEDEQSARAAAAGPDWVCGHCKAHNKQADAWCQSCGNPRDDISDDIALQEKEYDPDNVPQTGQRDVNNPYLSAPEPRPRRRIWRWLAIGVLAVGGICWLLAADRQATVAIRAFGWERTVEMEHYEEMRREDWRLPQGAFNTRSFQAIHHYNKQLAGYQTRTRTVQVQTGTERYVCGKTDKGNGYFVDRYCTRPVYSSRQETYQEPRYVDVPVYATRYSYSIYDWAARETIRAGGQDQQARWPSKSYPDPKQWREGHKTEQYWIMVEDRHGQLHKEMLPAGEWSQYHEGEKLPASEQWLTGRYFGLIRDKNKR